MVTNLNNKEHASNLLEQIVDLTNSNPFENGMSIFIDENGHLVLIERPDGNNGHEVMLTTYSKFLEVANQSQEIIREKMKIAKLGFTSISGILPQSELVFCLGAYGEGIITDNSLTTPSFQGGQIFVLGLRACNLNFALKNERIPNVGVPTTIFVIRTEKIIQTASTSSTMNNDINSSIAAYKVTAMFAACIKGKGRIDEDTPMYYYPFSNVSSTNYRVCLGSVFGTDLLIFERASHLDRLPIQFYSTMASTHELQVNYASKDKLSYKEFLLSLINKPFNEDELKPMNLTYKEFINTTVSSLYR